MVNDIEHFALSSARLYVAQVPYMFFSGGVGGHWWSSRIAGEPVSYRSQIRFHSGFPYDSVEDDLDIIQWPGRNIVDALKAAFEAAGYRVSEPISMEHVGWELDIWSGRRRRWLRLNLAGDGECYLYAENMSFWLWPDMPKYRPFLLDLQRILSSDERFGQVEWFSTGGIDRGDKPAAGPFDV